jgi:hypothetical protein
MIVDTMRLFPLPSPHDVVRYMYEEVVHAFACLGRSEEQRRAEIRRRRFWWFWF